MRKLLYMVASLAVSLWAMSAEARTLTEGTVSINGSSSTSFQSRDFDHGDTSEFRVSVSGGYFLIDNLEAGTGVSYDKFNSSSTHTASWSLTPFAQYHFPVADKADIYGGAGFILTHYDRTFSAGDADHQNSYGVSFTVGGEYFLTQNVALDLRFTYSRIHWDLKNEIISEDHERRLTGPLLGITVYL